MSPLYLAQEAYCNLYKDAYGIKPRNIDPVLWDSLEWVESQIAALCAPKEQPELGYFEELLAQLGE